MKNLVQWFDIATKNIERAKDFYTKVFNLEFQFIETPDSKMYMFGDSTKVGSAGCLVQSANNTPHTDGTILYFSCEDVANEASRVEEAGGKLLFPKTSIGEFGFIAQLIDTEGNRIGLHSNQ
ncbi:MAG TPA: VOC family protein [Arcobacter sp.]|nr:VOC family protein [Arcobacter sp.]